MKTGVWAEVNGLRSKAGLPAVEPKGLMLNLAQNGAIESNSRTLLDMMDEMPRSDGIEFDLPSIAVELKIEDFNF